MAVREGYVHPSFVKQVREIDTFSQRLRHQMVISIVERKSEGLNLAPAELAEAALNQGE